MIRDQASLPQYVIEPPDVLTIEAVLRDPQRPVRSPSGSTDRRRLRRPARWNGEPGRVGNGPRGRPVDLQGRRCHWPHTTRLLHAGEWDGRARLETLDVTVDVKNKNSQVYYIIADMGQGEQTYRMPYTGSECVLDAIAAIPGLAALADRRSIRVVRKGAGDRIFCPWTGPGILQHGDTRTNYALDVWRSGLCDW